MVHKITIGELEKYHQMGSVLIDVRDPLEYQQGHLEHAINIPYQNILQGVRNYSKDTVFILYCSTGRRSNLASNLLSSMGYQNVLDLGKVSC